MPVSDEPSFAEYEDDDGDGDDENEFASNIDTTVDQHVELIAHVNQIGHFCVERVLFFVGRLEVLESNHALNDSIVGHAQVDCLVGVPVHGDRVPAF